MVREKAGTLIGTGLRFAVVVGRFNELVTGRLLEGVVDCLTRHGVSEEDVTVYRVPGSFEIPQAARKAAETDVDAVVCVGALIRGDTMHFDVLANQAVRDVAAVGRESGKPVAFGIITADTLDQALERAGSKAGNKGWQAALSALEMASLWREIDGN
ncbi:MAG: 6,7-dimethyl-8-ribityllumazine synthase [Candidatus Krumholzibacteriota bacterium]|nr:6,7-dimethyl-8-ribityllumazine synthase [Candidatus Krumholzibacteriota bacterium]